jgi:hypothetical protein
MISLKRPLGRTAMVVGVGKESLAASAAAIVLGTGTLLRARHHATAFWRA